METLSPTKFASRFTAGDFRDDRGFGYTAAWIDETGKINVVDWHSQYIEERFPTEVMHGYASALDAGCLRLMVYVSHNISVGYSSLHGLSDKHKTALYTLLALLSPEWLTVSSSEGEETWHSVEAVDKLKKM